jgi:hypothetical protein
MYSVLLQLNTTVVAATGTSNTVATVGSATMGCCGCTIPVLWHFVHSIFSTAISAASFFSGNSIR